MRDYEINSDLISVTIQKKLKFKQYDNGSTIKVNLYENGEKVNIDSAWTIVAKFKRSDRSNYNRDITSISDNAFTVTLDSTVTSIVGDLEIDFKITYGDKQVTTFTVLLEIEESIGEGNPGDIGDNTGGNTEINVDLSNLKLSLDGTDLILKNGTTDLSRVTLPTIGGKNIELQASTDYIQWRYVGDTDWTNLIALSDLKGANGRGISSIENTAGYGLDMEYTITYTDGTTSTFYITNGAKGDKGDTGATPNLAIGTVETLESGSSATASITGTTENPLLNLGIPRGNDGESGTGTGSSEKEWEYIETIETTEDVKSVVKNFDKEYSELYVKMFVENNSADATGSLVFIINGKKMVATNTANFGLTIGKLGSGTRELLILNSLHPLIITGVGGMANNTWQPTPVIGFNSDTYSDSPFSVGEKISKIEFVAGSSATTFATGAKFIIYGR